MKRSHLVTAWALLGWPIFAVSASRAQLSCPPMPDKITQVNHDVRSDVEAGVGTLGKLKAGQLGVKTDVVAKNLFEKYPNADRLLVVQMMSATYCDMIRGSTTLKDSEKLRLWSEFSERVFKFQNPTYKATPPQAPKSKPNPPPGSKSTQAPESPESGKTGGEKPVQAILPSEPARRILEDGNIYENQPNKLEVKDPGTTFTNNTVRNMDAGVSNGAAASNNDFEGRSNTGNTGQSQPSESNGANIEAIRAAQTRNQYPGGFPDTPPKPQGKGEQAARAPSTGPNSPPIGGVTQGAGSAFSNNQQGGVTAGTYNNFSDKFPRPGVVPTVTMCVTNKAPTKTTITISTDSPITAPYWWFAFDGAVSDFSVEMLNMKEPYGSTHGLPTQEQSASVHVPIDQLIFVQITEIGNPFGGPWRPFNAGDEVRVTITSKNPGKITSVEPGSQREHVDERIVFACPQ